MVESQKKVYVRPFTEYRRRILLDNGLRSNLPLCTPFPDKPNATIGVPDHVTDRESFTNTYLRRTVTDLKDGYDRRTGSLDFRLLDPEDLSEGSSHLRTHYLRVVLQSHNGTPFGRPTWVSRPHRPK